MFSRLQLLAKLHELLSELHGILGSEPELKAGRLLRANAVFSLHSDIHRTIGGGELAKPHLLERWNELHFVAHRNGSPLTRDPP